MSISSEFLDRLALFMMRKNVSIPDVAAAAEVSPSTLNRARQRYADGGAVGLSGTTIDRVDQAMRDWER